jgi:hypothetical protein
VIYPDLPKPPVQFNGVLSQIAPPWLEPVFLCKNARKDVERALARKQHDATRYIIPATAETEKKALRKDLNDTRQGIILCFQIHAVRYRERASFLKHGIDHVDEKIDPIFDGKKHAIEQSRSTVGNGKIPAETGFSCNWCKHCKLLKVASAYICGTGKFEGMRDVDGIDDDIECDGDDGFDPRSEMVVP